MPPVVVNTSGVSAILKLFYSIPTLSLLCLLITSVQTWNAGVTVALCVMVKYPYIMMFSPVGGSNGGSLSQHFCTPH